MQAVAWGMQRHVRLIQSSALLIILVLDGCCACSDGLNDGGIAELFGTARGDAMHISISFYFNAFYIGPRAPFYHGEIDLHRVGWPPATQPSPATHPVTSAP